MYHIVTVWWGMNVMFLFVIAVCSFRHHEELGGGGGSGPASWTGMLLLGHYPYDKAS